MTTPEQKRERARLLREVASTISTKAWQLDDDLDTLLKEYPHSESGVWWGPAATEFYDGVEDVRTEVRTLRTDVLGYAPGLPQSRPGAGRPGRRAGGAGGGQGVVAGPALSRPAPPSRRAVGLPADLWSL